MKAAAASQGLSVSCMAGHTQRAPSRMRQDEKKAAQTASVSGVGNKEATASLRGCELFSFGRGLDAANYRAGR